MKQNLSAIIFDCDGVLAETERDGHRVAYNLAMKAAGVDAEWSVSKYAELVRITGGKERLLFFFSENPTRFPPEQYNFDLVKKIYSQKTEIFKAMAFAGEMPGRSGIARIITEAHAKQIKLFVCSTSHIDSVLSLLKNNFGSNITSYFTDFFCGDVVANKKPAPDIYLLAAEKYHLDPNKCLVVEDSENGLRAAKAAGMHCIVTPSYYTVHEDFSSADAIVSCLGDPDGEKTDFISVPFLYDQESYVTLSMLERLVLS